MTEGQRELMITSCSSWQALLPAIRRMELARELAAGRFFGGINSLQFAPLSVERELEQAERSSQTYWMNAADPASIAGLYGGPGKTRLMVTRRTPCSCYS
ncbi:MAG: hypothetical protein LBI86_07915 [Treponema sp.]|nr:hypothetical protein [Treponema sp.]